MKTPKLIFASLGCGLGLILTAAAQSSNPPAEPSPAEPTDEVAPQFPGEPPTNLDEAMPIPNPNQFPDQQSGPEFGEEPASPDEFGPTPPTNSPQPPMPWRSAPIKPRRSPQPRPAPLANRRAVT